MARAKAAFHASLFLNLSGAFRRATLQSALAVRKECADAGFAVQLLVSVDPADHSCREWLSGEGVDVWLDVPKGPQSPGTLPKEWIQASSGEYVALLEAPDLISRSWLRQSLELFSTLPEERRMRTVLQPALVLFPSLEHKYLAPANEPEPWVHARLSAFAANPWGTAFVARREILEANPIPNPEFDGDCPVWTWACEILGKGITRVSVPETVHLVQTRERALRTGCPGKSELSIPGPSNSFRSLEGDGFSPPLIPGGLHFCLAVFCEELETLAPDLVHLRGADWKPLTPPTGAILSAKLFRQALAAFPQSPDLMILQHFFSRGGSEKETLLNLEAIGRLRPELRCGVILTEVSPSPWLARVPAEVPVLELGLLARGMSGNDRRILLLQLLRQLAPRVINNVISPLGWDAFVRYPEALTRRSRLWVTEFCINKNDLGNLDAFSYTHLPEVWNSIELLLADNQHLLDHLKTTFGFDRGQLLRFPPGVPILPAKPRASRAGPLKVLWAGRFSRQKRVDLLLEIARRCPGFEFHVFGTRGNCRPSQLAMEKLEALPQYVGHGEFDSFQDISPWNFDVLLYTSEWDGMPNVVLEAMACGIPVIAPAVGGIPEALNKSTGYLVSTPEGENVEHVVDEYVTCLHTLQADPLGAFLKTKRAQEHLSRERGTDQFDQVWAKLLENIKPRPRKLARGFAPAHA